MPTHKILVLPGDGIGPEVTTQALRVLDAITQNTSTQLEFINGFIGGSAIDHYDNPLPDETLKQANDADAILLGAVGGPKWDKLSSDKRPEKGLLGIRSKLKLFANLRPAILYPELSDASTLKPEFVAGLDIMIVRELTGGLYFGQPRGITVQSNGKKVGVNTMIYTEEEIERIAHAACQIAMKRNKRLCSVDKANVLDVSMLWREVVEHVAKKYPEVVLSHMYVDNAAMQLVRNPKQFDVIVTENMFGDILSDCAAMLTGSIGMLASASLNSEGKGMYEPVHGSAPDIAGQNIANPIAAILSAAMMLRYSFNEDVLAKKIENAIAQVLKQGLRTADIGKNSDQLVTTQAMGDAIIAAI